MSRQKDAIKTASPEWAKDGRTRTKRVIVPRKQDKPLLGHRGAILGHSHETATVKPTTGPENLEALLTIDALMALLGVSRPTVYTLMEQEHLPYLKLGRSLRFRPSAIHIWLLEHEQLH